MRRCLVVVDFQNDFVSGSLGTSEAREIADRVASKIEDCREQGDDIIFTLDTHDEDYLESAEGRSLPILHCVAGTDGHVLCTEVAKVRMPEDKVIEKPTFGSAELFDYFRENPYDEIELVGLVTDICVLANGVLAKTACPEANVLVDASCTTATTPELKKAALDVMRSLQIKVVNDD